MTTDHISKVAQELNLPIGGVRSTVNLLDDSATVPFIARYRKEATGSLDEVQITEIRDRVKQLRDLDKRRDAVLKSIKDQKKLTDELKEKILAAETMSVLEDLYLPYKPKRRTRATVAKEKGLEPLAEMIYKQDGIDPSLEAETFIDEEKGVKTTADALAGARDIIAEWINENAQARQALRKVFEEQATITAKVIKGKDKEGSKFKDYFDWSESVVNCPSHRVLAVRRGEKEGFLMARITAPEDICTDILKEMFVKGEQTDSAQVVMAIEDSYKRLLSLSLETEMRLELKKRADIEAIEIFKKNLYQLLMGSPMGGKNVLAVDPGYRTGCKVVCLDQQGKLLKNETIYPTGSAFQEAEAEKIIEKLIDKYKIEVVAVGNGTASRETEQFLKSLPSVKEIPVVMVSETGASVYSASEVAREEFPDYDVTVRGAVSIGRRLMDPLAELVKIDPKSIGVGQYQHDVDQGLLKSSLDDVVVSCVNQVGVEVNTSSKELLTYVAGLGPVRAQSIIDFRNQNGPLRSRLQLNDIKGLGPKAIEQAAGFLRIHDGEYPLDHSAVHPERYPIVEKMAKDLECGLEDLLQKEALRNRLNLNDYITDEIGLPTLVDIREELAKPGRDPREPFQLFSFKEGVDTIDDLVSGMMLPGVVTNVTAFGAFVDIGVHHDGLVHISELADRFIKDPGEVVKMHQQVQVKVLEIDTERGRIALSMRQKN